MPKRTIFIWDVHWCYQELKLLIQKINLNKEDKVYFVWDYINKWPKSFKVLKYIYKNREQFTWVLWNHDYDFLKKIEKNTHLNKSETKLYKKLNENPEILFFFKNLPLYVEKENFILLHWWIFPNKKLEEHTWEEITNIRNIENTPWYDLYLWKKKIIYWHWASQWLTIKNNSIWLDSGCCYWAYLSSYILETWEIIQQSSMWKYVDINYTKQD
jgi:hypothetical protein